MTLSTPGRSIPTKSELTGVLRDWADDCYQAGEWSLEAPDAVTGVVLVESEVVTSG